MTVGSGEPDTRQTRAAGRVMLTSVEREVCWMTGVTNEEERDVGKVRIT